MLDVQMFISESDLSIKKLGGQTTTLVTEMKDVKDLLGSPEQLALLIEPLIKKSIAAKKTKSVLSPNTTLVVTNDDSDEDGKKYVQFLNR
jgi:hypothetical protein